MERGERRKYDERVRESDGGGWQDRWGEGRETASERGGRRETGRDSQWRQIQLDI